MFYLIPSDLPLSLRSPRTLAALGAGAATAIGLVIYLFTRKRPTAEELERERRDLIALTGRITDGTIMDTMVGEAGKPTATTDALAESAESEDTVPTPNIIVYNYRIAGVTYECAQDVTALASYVRGVRSDLPIQVRYAPHNPGNSIIVADSWSGLRLNSAHPYTVQGSSDSH
jgi:hypothetical protein